ncbi:hypothetical protein ACTIVE_8196 [Actinomadura verrucosospora]|uniref:Uncharacterized protein n=1 Tax=Actinomadura verrucosospora TaxID=46165 RepID=A0A7D3ZSG3_ACTVE|nr:hypothetical protein ACTIVE_8196 [Actinomadura verrucosospora]
MLAALASARSACLPVGGGWGLALRGVCSAGSTSGVFEEPSGGARAWDWGAGGGFGFGGGFSALLSGVPERPLSIYFAGECGRGTIRKAIRADGEVGSIRGPRRPRGRTGRPGVPGRRACARGELGCGRGRLRSGERSWRVCCRGWQLRCARDVRNGRA